MEAVLQLKKTLLQKELGTRKHWDSKSKGWRVMKVLELLHQLYHSEASLRINLTSLYSLQYVLTTLLPGKERSQKSFEIVAENVLNVHPAHPKLSLYYMPLFQFHQCSPPSP